MPFHTVADESVSSREDEVRSWLDKSEQLYGFLDTENYLKSCCQQTTVHCEGAVARLGLHHSPPFQQCETISKFCG